MLCSLHLWAEPFVQLGQCNKDAEKIKGTIFYLEGMVKNLKEMTEELRNAPYKIRITSTCDASNLNAVSQGLDLVLMGMRDIPRYEISIEASKKYLTGKWECLNREQKINAKRILSESAKSLGKEKDEKGRPGALDSALGLRKQITLFLHQCKLIDDCDNGCQVNSFGGGHLLTPPPDEKEVGEDVTPVAPEAGLLNLAPKKTTK